MKLSEILRGEAFVRWASVCPDVRNVLVKGKICDDNCLFAEVYMLRRNGSVASKKVQRIAIDTDIIRLNFVRRPS